MRVGLLGGTFNPIHNAHLRIADEALKACRLDRMILIPAADPPHKPLAGDIPFEQRCRMVELAIKEHPSFEISRIEGERGGKSYSIDTILSYSAMQADDELFFIIGGDSFLEIGLWYRYAEIFAACSLIVLQRPGSAIAEPLATLPEAVRGEFHYEQESRLLRHRAGTTVQFVSGSPMDISSTKIRQLAAQGQPVDKFVPPLVAAYISQQRIYTHAEKESRN